MATYILSNFVEDHNDLRRGGEGRKGEGGGGEGRNSGEKSRQERRKGERRKKRGEEKRGEEIEERRGEGGEFLQSEQSSAVTANSFMERHI